MTAAIQRHKTAIQRGGLSRPVKLLLEQRLLREDQTFFDFGCGYGEDVEHLSDHGVQAAGWDPFHRPNAPQLTAHVVAITYVLNVIEDVEERQQALLGAWDLCSEYLVVTALVVGDKPGRYLLPYADGVVTGQGTFQKYFQQDDLRQFIEDTIDGVEAIPLALGVFIAFRDPVRAREYEVQRFHRRLEGQLASRTRGRQTDLGPYVAQLFEFLMERGRFPRNEELEELREPLLALGGRTRAERFLQLKFGEEIDDARLAREDDLLVFLALDHFKRRRIKLSALPRATQLDIKDLFGTLKKAKVIAQLLLYGLGEVGTISESCRRAPVGKLMPDALYVHTDYVEVLPVSLRVLEGLATAYAGRVDGATLVKFDKHRPRVSYLFYPEFDRDPHPSLHWAVVAELGRLNVRFFDFSARENPPVLHRKELFVMRDYPGFDLFSALTQAEVRAGLFENPDAIGTRDGWNAILESRGMRIVDHQLRRDN